MARYADAIRWVADNDEPDEDDPIVTSEMISVAMIADVWGKTTARVAEDVLRVRARQDGAR